MNDYEYVNVDAERQELEADARAEVADALAQAKAERDALLADAKFEREKEYGFGNVWTTEEVQREFTLESFRAPVVFVIRKSDGARGTLLFDHSPRVYFGFSVR